MCLFQAPKVQNTETAPPAAAPIAPPVVQEIGGARKNEERELGRFGGVDLRVNRDKSLGGLDSGIGLNITNRP